MAGPKMIATRESYGRALAELGAVHDNIVVFDSDLSESTKTCMFRDAFPDRHFNCGIAEANMMAAAAGMAASGFVAFASSFAMFASGRAYEQIRNSVGYPRLNVKIGASHGGISVGEDGASHQCCEDFALMRTIPGMTVICPSDDLEAHAAVYAAYEHEGPVYMRFGRAPAPVLHGSESDFRFEIGKGEILRDGTDLTIIATGVLVYEALLAADELAGSGISARVINMATIKPIDHELVVRAARETGRILTAEEHSIVGGLGEAVCAVTSEHFPVPVHRVGLRDVFGHSGAAAALLKEFGLCAENLVVKSRELLKV